MKVPIPEELRSKTNQEIKREMRVRGLLPAVRVFKDAAKHSVINRINKLGIHEPNSSWSKGPPVVRYKRAFRTIGGGYPKGEHKPWQWGHKHECDTQCRAGHGGKVRKHAVHRD